MCICGGGPPLFLPRTRKTRSCCHHAPHPFAAISIQVFCFVIVVLVAVLRPTRLPSSNLTLFSSSSSLSPLFLTVSFVSLHHPPFLFPSSFLQNIICSRFTSRETLFLLPSLSQTHPPPTPTFPFLSSHHSKTKKKKRVCVYIYVYVSVSYFRNARRSARVCAWNPVLMGATEREDPHD